MSYEANQSQDHSLRIENLDLNIKLVILWSNGARVVRAFTISNNNLWLLPSKVSQCINR